MSEDPELNIGVGVHATVSPMGVRHLGGTRTPTTTTRPTALVATTDEGSCSRVRHDRLVSLRDKINKGFARSYGTQFLPDQQVNAAHFLTSDETTEYYSLLHALEVEYAQTPVRPVEYAQTPVRENKNALEVEYVQTPVRKNKKQKMKPKRQSTLHQYLQTDSSDESDNLSTNKRGE